MFREPLSLDPLVFALIVFAVAIVFIALLARTLHRKLTKPIREVANSCASGHLPALNSPALTREIRIITEYLRQIQDRADSRADQIQRMERELIATRRERDRSFRKLEEYEDLLASYNRIRSELDIDNRSLRKEAKELHLQNEVYRQEAKSLRKHSETLPTEFLKELRLNSQQISELSLDIAKQWEGRSLSSNRESLIAISEKCEAQKASIENALSENADEPRGSFPIQDDIRNILNPQHSGRFELQMHKDPRIISNGRNEKTLTFLKSFSRMLSEQVDHGKLDIDIEGRESQYPSLSLTVQTEEFIGETITPESVSELARSHGVQTDAIDSSDNKLRFTLPLQQFQAH